MSIEMNYFVEFLDLVRGSRVGSFRSNFYWFWYKAKTLQTFILLTYTRNIHFPFLFSIKLEIYLLRRLNCISRQMLVLLYPMHLSNIKRWKIHHFTSDSVKWRNNIYTKPSRELIPTSSCFCIGQSKCKDHYIVWLLGFPHPIHLFRHKISIKKEERVNFFHETSCDSF